MWAELGLTDEVLAELYRRGRRYAATRISLEHQEDAIEDGMLRILQVVLNPPESYPEDPAKRLSYLTRTLRNVASKHVGFLDTNIPLDPE